MGRAINIVAILGTIVLVITAAASMRGTFPASFRLLELVAAITVLVAVISGMVVAARDRKRRG